MNKNKMKQNTTKKSAKARPVKAKKNDDTIVINLNDVVSVEVIAKLKKRCDERGLAFPSGIATLIEEISNAGESGIAKKPETKAGVRAAKRNPDGAKSTKGLKKTAVKKCKNFSAKKVS